MAGSKDFKFEVVEFMGNIRGPEDNWGITVTRMKWNDDAPTVNIRSTNLMKGIVGKGVALSTEETDLLVDTLLAKDYGSIDAIETALERRRRRLSYDSLEEEELSSPAPRTDLEVTLRDFLEENSVDRIQ